ncbi:prephenate dehydrogenase [Actinoplanes rectilineatus]|uniref:prephenate dehydrogenase n=1 Tax=Actinoplanes rectilineatus TaxID=113571 RepID=UPI0005F29FA2|nr:prephenate dehydrogenase/arogenate dehydrogenase family protein [Actinoplanes rectilineatus]
MRTAVIGLGLIGGSLLRASAAAGHETTGFDVDPATREAARAAGHRVAETVGAAVEGADVTVVGVPLTVLHEVLPELAGHDGLVTDVTSVKGPVRDLMAKHGIRRFVGGHPMAGKETSGFAASDPDLFTGCAWVLCLEPHGTDLGDWLTLARLFTGMGARVVPVTADEHDDAVAGISHVPHLVAAALAAPIAADPLAGALAAGSFRDGTRVAATRAALTAAMCGGNASAVHRRLRSIIDDLTVMADALSTGDPVPALIPHLKPGERARKAWPAAPGRPETVVTEIEPLLALGRSGGWVTSVGDGDVLALRPESGRNRS